VLRSRVPANNFKLSLPLVVREASSTTLTDNWTRLQRLYVDAPLQSESVLEVDEKKTHYMQNVLRFRMGDMLRVFNGKNGEYIASFESDPMVKEGRRSSRQFNSRLAIKNLIREQLSCDHGVHIKLMCAAIKVCYACVVVLPLLNNPSWNIYFFFFF
jgi:hypothetical protein